MKSPKPELSNKMVGVVSEFSYKLTDLKTESEKLNDPVILAKVKQIQELFKEVDKKLLQDYSYDMDGI